MPVFGVEVSCDRLGWALLCVVLLCVAGCSPSSSTPSVRSGVALKNGSVLTPTQRKGQKLMLSLYERRKKWAKEFSKLPSVRVAKASVAAKKPEKLKLLEILKIAYQRSPSMREARYKLLAMKARESEAFWSNWWPQGTLVGLIAPAPPARGDAVNTTTPYPAAIGSFSDYGLFTRVDFNLIWPLYTFGKLSLLLDAAKHGVKLGQQNVTLEKAKWTLLVKRIFYGMQFAESSLVLLDEAEEYVEQAKKRVKGKTDKLKIIVIDTQLKARRVQAESAQKMALSTMSRLIGMAPKKIKLEKPELEEPSFPIQPLTTYLKLANQHRPEIHLLSSAVKAKKALMMIQQRMWAPDFFIGAFFRAAYHTAADDQLSPFARDDFIFLESGISLGLRFTIDIPQKLARARRAEAEYEALRSRRNLAIQGILLQIEERFRKLETAIKLMKIQKTGTKAANSWLTRTMISFSSGLVEVKEVSDALLALAQTRFGLIQATYDAWVAASELSRAVGIDITVLPKPQPKPKSTQKVSAARP